MIPAADERIVQGARRLFRRINDLQVFDATPPAFLAHDLGQRAHGGLIDIRYTKSRGIQFVSGAHGADDRNFQQVRLLDDSKFPFHRVYGIHDIVVLREIDLRLGFRHEKGYHLDFARTRKAAKNQFLEVPFNLRDTGREGRGI